MIDRIVYINGRFLCRTQTGVDRYGVELLRVLDHWCGNDAQVVRGFQFVLLVPHGASAPVWQPRRIAIRVCGRLKGQLWEQFSLPWASRGHPLLNFCNAAPIVKRRQVVTIHDATVVRHPESFSLAFRSWYRVLMPLVARNARAVVTVSDFSATEISRCYRTPREKLVVVHSSAGHVARITPDYSVTRRLGLQDGGYVLGVATNAPHKNVGALRYLAQRLRGESIPVVLVGGGNRRIFAAQPASDDAQSGLVRTGYMNDSELVALYRRAACFVFPSLYEGFGLPPVEAMALGCPVVASSAAAMPEVLGDAAVYFDPHDTAGLAMAVKRVLNDATLRNALISKGHEQANRYRWEDSARKFVALCEKLA